MTIVVYRWRNDNSTVSMESSETSSPESARTKALDGTESRDSVASLPTSSMSSRTPMMETPAWTMPGEVPQRGLVLTWSFIDRPHAEAWASLLRDMVPCADHMWKELPQWTPKWAIGVHSNLRDKDFLVALVLWPEPSIERSGH